MVLNKAGKSLNISIERIRREPEQGIAELYRSFRDEFVSWARRKYKSDEETLLDSFQDAVVVLYAQIRRDESLQVSSGLKTYLFALGKNILLNKLRKKKFELPLLDNVPEIQGDIDVDELYEAEQAENQVAVLVKDMDEPCRSILKYYYYENLSMDEIAKTMGYKNPDTVKSQKSRCMKYLKNAVSEWQSKLLL